LPKSPRSLIKVGWVVKARHVINHRYDDDSQGYKGEADFRDILASFELAGTVSLRAMFTMGPELTFHRLCLAFITQIMLQMTGVKVVTA
jgi:hypothetical protein